MPIEATRQKTEATLVDLIDRILDKGLVINADIQVAVAGVELLGIKIRAALSSFETAVRYGLEFPSGTRLEKEAQDARRGCPLCQGQKPAQGLIQEGPSWQGPVPLDRRQDGHAGGAGSQDANSNFTRGGEA